MRGAADPEASAGSPANWAGWLRPAPGCPDGGATAVLEGWRPSIVDVDVRFEPESDAALARIAALGEELSLEVFDFESLG